MSGICTVRGAAIDASSIVAAILKQLRTVQSCAHLCNAQQRCVQACRGHAAVCLFLAGTESHQGTAQAQPPRAGLSKLALGLEICCAR